MTDDELYTSLLANTIMAETDQSVSIYNIKNNSNYINGTRTAFQKGDLS